jgi:hypothetical protein
MSFSQVMPSPDPNQPAAVAGNRMMDDAKIGGITPDMFNFKRQVGTLAAVDLVADLSFGVIHQNLALALFDKDHETGDQPPRHK